MQRISRKRKIYRRIFYGFKLHIIINDMGEIIDFVITPGNVDDREPLKSGNFLKRVSGK
ncbi:MAG: transposase [Chlorobi bacterium]|nr:transposase [Chlorobiota bacterium]